MVTKTYPEIECQYSVSHRTNEFSEGLVYTNFSSTSTISTRSRNNVSMMSLNLCKRYK